MKINLSRFDIGDTVRVVAQDDLIETPYAVRPMLAYAGRKGTVIALHGNCPIVRVAFCKEKGMPKDSGWWFHDSALISIDEEKMPLVMAGEIDSMY